MPVIINAISPAGDAPVFDGFSVSGATTQGGQNVMIFYEIPANGVQSANMTAVSDTDGKWAVTFTGKFRQGAEITAIARAAHETLARLTKIL